MKKLLMVAVFLGVGQLSAMTYQQCLQQNQKLARSGSNMVIDCSLYPVAANPVSPVPQPWNNPNCPECM